MERHLSMQILALVAATVAFSALPAVSQTVVEESYKIETETTRTGAALPSPSPAVQKQVIEEHRTETTTIEQPAVPPPPAVVEKKTVEETITVD